MTDGSVADIRLGNLAHFNRGLDADVRAELLQRIAQRKRIHRRCQHTDMVCARSVHMLAGAASPEVAAPDDDTDFHAFIRDLFDGFTDAQHRFVINTLARFTGKHLAGELQQDSFISDTHNEGYLQVNIFYYIII